MALICQHVTLIKLLTLQLLRRLLVSLSLYIEHAMDTTHTNLDMSTAAKLQGKRPAFTFQT